MAAPTLTLLNHTLLNAADVNTNWTLLTTADTDLKKEGSGSMSGIFRANLAVGYYTAASAPVTAVGKTLRGWWNTANVAYMNILANGGYELSIYDGTTTFYKALIGSDTYFGGWYNVVQSMDEFSGNVTLANVRRWGARANQATAKNVVNMWMDAWRYLDGFSMTGGSSGDKIRLSDIEVADRGTTTLYGYGVVTVQEGVYFCTGKLQFGTGATSMYFEMDGQVLIFGDHAVAAGLYSISAIGTGSNVVIKNSVIKAAGSTDATRYTVDFSEANLAALQFTDNLLTRASTIAFKAGQTVTGNTFDNCGVVTAGGAVMTGCTYKSYAGVADSSMLVWSYNADLDSKIDNSSFTKGTNAHHAITLGTSAPTSHTLRGITFTGFNASDGQNDSVLLLADKGTDTVWTINASGCSGTVSYKKVRSGDEVTVNVDQVTLTIEVRDKDGALITDSTEVTLVRSSDTTVLSHAEDVTSGSTGYTYGYAGDVTCYVNVLSVDNYVPRTVEPVVLGEADQTVVVQLEDERGRYSNP